MESASHRLTVTEVAVVVIVLGCVLAVLSTSLVASREEARARHCSRNLRRLDRAVAEFRDYSQKYPNPHSWPLDLLGPLENGPIRRPELNAFRMQRPWFLTCPSQPLVDEGDAFYQQNHYVTVIRNHSQPDETWEFRDRGVAEVSNASGHWCIGVTVFLKQGEREPDVQRGPHANGSFLQSDSQGKVTVLGRAK